MKQVVTIFILALFIGCSVSQRLQSSNAHAEISQLSKAERNNSFTQEEEEFKKVLKLEHRGDSVYLVDVDTLGGEQIPSIRAATVNVSGNMRNVPERNGKVSIDFRITIPKNMLGNQREILLEPRLTNTDSIRFEPIRLCGETLTILQKREYWQYSTYVKRFYRDSSTVGKAYQKFVRFPVDEGFILDSMVERKSDIVYFYHKELESSRISSNRIYLTLPGIVRAIDGSEYMIPPSDTIGYVMSSLLSFIDTTTKYKIKVIDRYVDVSSEYALEFKEGDYFLIETLGDNQSQIDSILALRNKILKCRDEYQIDSISITAYSSPEGSFKFNRVLSMKRAKSVASTLFPEDSVKVYAVAENWKGLQDSLKRYPFFSSIDKIIREEKNPDERENKIRWKYPKEYRYMRDHIYPSLRTVKIRYSLERRGMAKDTIHLKEVDTVYMAALYDLKKRNYARALKVLSAYQDHNTAIALLSFGYDAEAKRLIESKDRDSDVKEYLLAILCSRLGKMEEGRRHYLNACNLNPRMEFRGNLDPEINKLLMK